MCWHCPFLQLACTTGVISVIVIKTYGEALALLYRPSPWKMESPQWASHTNEATYQMHPKTLGRSGGTLASCVKVSLRRGVTYVLLSWRGAAHRDITSTVRCIGPMRLQTSLKARYRHVGPWMESCNSHSQSHMVKWRPPAVEVYIRPPAIISPETAYTIPPCGLLVSCYSWLRQSPLHTLPSILSGHQG